MYKNGRRIQKKKTTVKSNTLNPYYNETLTFNKVNDDEIREGVYFYEFKKIKVLKYARKIDVFKHRMK